MENKIESGMNDFKGQMNGKASAFTDQAKKYTAEAYDTSVEQVKNNPMIALGAALALGVVAGILIARRK